METTPQFDTPCHYRQAGAFCHEGYLYQAVAEPEVVASCDTEIVNHKPVSIEGEFVRCPACDGTGRILTSLGKAAMQFFVRHMVLLIRPIVEEVVEEKIG